MVFEIEIDFLSVLLCSKNNKMSKNITPYKDSELGKKEQVAQMFDTISNNYDGLNKVISFGTDAKWKQKILKTVAASKPKSILDIATGTGDLAILFAATTAEEIIGLDISQGMLDIGKKKILAQHLDSKIQMVLGDGEKIPYSDNYFDVITVAYGVRNFENLEKGLSEILRVLKPNGTFIILETAVPTKFQWNLVMYWYLTWFVFYKIATISASKLRSLPAKGWLKSNHAPSSLIDCNTPAYCAPPGALNSTISPGLNSETSSVLQTKVSMETHCTNSGLDSPKPSLAVIVAERFSPTFAPINTFSKQGAN